MDDESRKMDASEEVEARRDFEMLEQDKQTVVDSSIHETDSSGDLVTDGDDSNNASALEDNAFMESEAELDGAVQSEYVETEAVELSEIELNEVIENICNSKAEEFRMLGYEHVTGREVWECISDKYKKTGVPRLHQIVNDILSLKVTSFMNWMTMSIYKSNPFK
ncbi:post-transcriptional regulator [Paenibacillus radicis (ex Xue et al. 2023)]|nr:post-transcriptional regulator [Paenibacillus radicis (ex Xue et al. 2023)]